MDKKIVEKIKNNPAYQELITKRSKFAWTLAILMLVVYYAFIMTIAFSPSTLGISMGGITTIGIPVGIFIIIFAFVLTGIYTKRANSEFDDLVKKVKDDVKGDLE
ncbi:MAG: DUF485 domain-containing protein [Epsilonproteobacteria bacterium]|nr:DUF485 domain-containing protein [Campylobacterota bacterium]